MEYLMSNNEIFWAVLLNPKTGRPVAKTSRHAFSHALSAASPHEGLRPICGAFESGNVEEVKQSEHRDCSRCRIIVRMKGYTEVVRG